MQRKHWLLSASLVGIFMLIFAATALADTIYTVQSGDTLNKIARRFDTSVQAIAQANNIVNPNYIYVGQQLTIPDGNNPPPTTQPPTPTPSDGGNPETYVVQAGDTLSRIAARFGVTLNALAQANGIANPNYIYVGQVLTIPGGGSNPTPQPTQPATIQPTSQPPQPTPTPSTGNPTTYVVQYGDTLVSIAQRFNVSLSALAQANGIANPNYIYVGQVLTIPGTGGEPQPTPTQPPPTAIPTQTSPPPTAIPTQTSQPQPTATSQPQPTATATQPPQPTATNEPPPPDPLGGFHLGGQTHTFANPGLMQDTGMTWVKFQHKWTPGESGDVVAGRISAAHNQGMQVLLSMPGANVYPTSIDFDAYVDFLGSVAALPDPPDAIEVWNEMNIDFEWPAGSISPQQYLDRMLKPGYTAIKNANSSIKVISGAPAPTGFFGGGCAANGCDDKPYMEELARLGAGQYMDCIGVHYNAGATSPNATTGHPADSGDGHYSWYYQPTIDVYFNAFGRAIPICITEIGYVSGEDFGGSLPPNFWWADGTSLREHANWLAEAVARARNSGYVHMFIVFNVDFTYYDPAGDPQAAYALIRPDGSCPACLTIETAARYPR